MGTGIGICLGVILLAVIAFFLHKNYCTKCSNLQRSSNNSTARCLFSRIVQWWHQKRNSSQVSVDVALNGTQFNLLIQSPPKSRNLNWRLTSYLYPTSTTVFQKTRELCLKFSLKNVTNFRNLAILFINKFCWQAYAIL